jgi:hypothetical protein
VTRLIIILALAGAVTVLVLFANLLLVATNAGAQNRPTEMISGGREWGIIKITGTDGPPPD